MPLVIGVRFTAAGKLYYFSPGALSLAVGESVVVETPRGNEIAQVVETAHMVDDQLVKPPLRSVLRAVTPGDLDQQAQRLAKEAEALEICRKKVQEHQLDMKLVRVEYNLDQSKLLVYFTSGGRVDFRKLVKDMASVFRTRIELKQIGVRDEARMIGGLGPCGRALCCTQHLRDFEPVSIRMAKDQSLSLNPTKISGVCGRLMCCLGYEHEQYQKTRKQMPKTGKEVITPLGRGIVVDLLMCCLGYEHEQYQKTGKEVITPLGRGIVVDLNPLMETIKVRVQQGDTNEVKEFPMQEIQRLHPPAPAAAEPKARGDRRKREPAETVLGAVVSDDEEFLGTDVEMICDMNKIADD